MPLSRCRPFLSLSRSEWLSRRWAHQERISRWTLPHRERRLRHEKDPIKDFLFDYYSFRPSLLERWSPGWNVALLDSTPDDFPGIEGWNQSEKTLTLGLESFPHHRLDSLRWIIRLLQTTLERPPQFACYGLHEWAMVYRADEVRHTTVPLRMTPQELATFVESQSICCTHFDAFRFYTPAARPLNHHQPSRENRLELEQSGCIHVNMDLYKWAYKFYPWTPSDWISEAFEFALETRHIDMRASPYDLSTWKIDPIRIETPEGRLDYIEHQRRIHQRGIPLRQKLLDFYKNILREIDSSVRIME